jgi:hypothetical protein
LGRLLLGCLGIERKGGVHGERKLIGFPNIMTMDRAAGTVTIVGAIPSFKTSQSWRRIGERKRKPKAFWHLLTRVRKGRSKNKGVGLR